MKKFAFLPLVLCLLLVLQCTVFPVYAVPIPVSTEETENETATQESEAPPQGSAIPFGQVSILNGCRTIEGMGGLRFAMPFFQFITILYILFFTIYALTYRR